MALANLLAHQVDWEPTEAELRDIQVLAPQDSENIDQIYKRPFTEYIEICRPNGAECMKVREGALGILVRCLRYALKGQKWVGITWGTFSVIHAMCNLSEIELNKGVLIAAGLVELLVQLLGIWQRQHSNSGNAGNNRNYRYSSFHTGKGVVIQPRELLLSLQIMTNLAQCERARSIMRHEDAVPILESIGESDLRFGTLDPSLWVLRDRHVGLCMSQHPRLGADSKLAMLDPAVMRLIVEYTCSRGGAGVLANSLAQFLKEDQHSLHVVVG
eukprot:CAMPEP_0184326092 /NCGR_PEP_ID=MMETSP1049-20130417/142376_1 /TAXON_ID=77928 /ORGANISM="Proteomonas sulcata, Strain CCMP704" /LENGTH=271 /DNA_ID=CAMNT_0026648263 /DNA_START=20 /DNA_END=835 /DNA_ORIENTATION=-